MAEGKPRGFADPEVRRKAAEARKRNKQKAPKSERTPKKSLPTKRDIRGVLETVLGGLAGNYDMIPMVGEDSREAWEQQQAILSALRSWCPEGDRLERFEVEMLADAVAEELVKRPRLIEPFMSIVDRAGDAKFALIVIAIALPRLARHGAIPTFVAQVLYAPVLAMLGKAREAAMSAPQPEPEGEPAPAPEPSPEEGDSGEEAE